MTPPAPPDATGDTPCLERPALHARPAGLSIISKTVCRRGLPLDGAAAFGLSLWGMTRTSSSTPRVAPETPAVPVR